MAGNGSLPSSQIVDQSRILDLLAAGELALFGTGDLTAARHHFDEAARRADATRDAESLGRAALGLGGLWVHEHRTAIEALRIGSWQRRALDTLDPATLLATRLRIRVAAEAAYRAGSSAAVLGGVAEARRSGDSLLLAEALNLAHHCLLGPEHAATRFSLAEELLALGTTVGRPIDVLMGLLWRTVDLFLVGDPHAGRSMNELRELAEIKGHAAVRFVVSAMDVMLTVRTGQLSRAEDLAVACRERGREVGDADALGWYGAHLVAIRWYEGRTAELVPMLSELAFSSTLPEPNDAYFGALAVAAADAGDRVEAAGALRCLCRNGLDEIPSSSTWLVSMLGVAEAVLLLGDADTAAAVYELLLPHADVPVMVSAIVCFGSAHYPLSAAALAAGKLDRAVDHLEAAVAANQALGNWPAYRLANRRLAAVLQQRDEGEPTKSSSGYITCRRVGRRWTLTLGSRSATVDDSVGMRYLAVLLARPGIEVAVADLAGSSLPGTAAQPVLDAAAKQAYKRRLEVLRAEIDEADDNDDVTRATRARAEYKQVLVELQHATGLGGRARGFADVGERARTAVQKAIRRAITRIRTADAPIGRELDDTIVTGMRCCYLPQFPQS